MRQDKKAAQKELLEEELNTQFLLWVVSVAEAGKEGIKRTDSLKRLYYLLKIFDFLWFEPDIPDDDYEQFSLFLNIRWPGNPSIFFSDVANLHNETLSYLSRKIARPQWLNENILYTEVNIKDLPRVWNRIETDKPIK
jgi:hypothetical protein